MDPDPELTPTWSKVRPIDGTAARDGVDSQKLQPKYGSGDGSRSGLDPHMI